MRLIPAWAGKTTYKGASVYQGTAHPRVGGENTQPRMSASPLYGSSPRGRGKPPTQQTPTPPPRLIPAWAGKTSPW